MKKKLGLFLIVIVLGVLGINLLSPKKHNNCADALRYIAECYYEQGDYEKVISDYEKVFSDSAIMRIKKEK